MILKKKIKSIFGWIMLQLIMQECLGFHEKNDIHYNSISYQYFIFHDNLLPFFGKKSKQAIFDVTFS